MTWAGTNNGSYPLAASALLELADLRLSAKQIQRAVNEVGQARVAERDASVEQLRVKTFAERRAGSLAGEPPDLAVIMTDGGRYQRRDNFAGEPTRQAGEKHWRESKVGCLLSMTSDVHESDPCPQFPEWLAESEAVRELASVSGKSAAQTGALADDLAAANPATYPPPELLARDVLASGEDVHSFGWQLESRAWQLGFPAAQRQAFVGDGAATNWTIQQRHFPQAVPILDLMHALSYACAAAAAVDAGDCYPRWAEWIWQGKVRLVIDQLAEHRERLGTPPADAQPSDPRLDVDRAWTYYTNNQGRMNYPEYRRQGLPLTSSHIESTVKQINQRIKGSEKFWRRDSGEAVLQLRADSLSDSQPLTPFWRRWQSQQTGSNHYRAAA